MKEQIKKCNLVIDLTQGDSFTDLYGLNRFYNLTSIKKYIVDKHIPLILGPQTYGPYKSPNALKYALKVINNAYDVIARDSDSQELINKYIEKEVFVATDLALGLDVNSKKKPSNKIKIGINPSGLLSSTKTESTEFGDSLKTNYDDYLNILIQQLTKEDKYEIHIIPHVGDEANNICGQYENVIYHKAFSSPVDAKEEISQMDIFVGSRMHATIAAFSTGVATIPVAYSKKFEGLYKSLEYNYIVDLRNVDTDEAIKKTLYFINNYKQLKKDASRSIQLANEKLSCLRERLKLDIIRLL